MAKTIGDEDRVDLVHRRTLPTAAFTLTVPQVRWIAEEAKRLRVSKSEVVREALDVAMTTTDTESEAA